MLPLDMILQTLYQNCVKYGTEFFNEFYVLDLILSEDENGNPVASGVVAYELATGELHVFQAKSIVFATGGAGKIFKTTSNAHTLTGDGLGIIFRKGLPLEDMRARMYSALGITEQGFASGDACRVPWATDEAQSAKR